MHRTQPTYPDTTIQQQKKKLTCPRVLGNWKKIYRVDFFAKASFTGLTNYIIRHNSKNGNMMSFLHLCRLINPLRWSLFKHYATEGNTVNYVSHIDNIICEYYRTYPLSFAPTAGP